nr:polysaccharide pyruvyl transferase family protein [Catenibacillus scindens]
MGYEKLKKGAERYEAVITGSDQLWSPAGLPTNFFNLMFVPDKIRKISYASSFGVKQIPWYQIKRTAYYLNRIDYISMRENRGAEIVKELTGRKVPVILDPVFMFDKSGWEKLIPVNKEFNHPYIFAYFLGKNSEYREVVREAANQLGCKVVTLRHLDQYVADDEKFGDFAPYDVGPDRFLNLLRDAKYICTDSYHGSCFSIIHQKPFIIFSRYSENSKHSKNSRIETLCDNLELQDRKYNRSMNLVDQLESKIDYEIVNEHLKKLKKITEDFLNQAFSNLR